MTWILTNWRALLPGAAACAVVFIITALLWRCDALEKRHLAEAVAHRAAKADLEHWKALYREALEVVDAHRENAAACLGREAEAREAAEERKAVLQTAPPRPRTETEKNQVVNDATRKKSAARLNRPL